MYLIVQVSLYKNFLSVKIITTDTVMQTMRELFNVSIQFMSIDCGEGMTIIVMTYLNHKLVYLMKTWIKMR